MLKREGRKANMRMKKPLSIGFIALLILSMAMVLVPVSADTHPGNAVWVDPGSFTTLHKCDTIIVDVMVNLTTFAAGAKGMFGFEYKLFWNSTVLKATEIRYNTAIPGWVYPLLFTTNKTGVWSGGPKDKLDYHWLALAPSPGSAYNSTKHGVVSLCRYKFHVEYQPYYPEPDFSGTIDIQDDKFKDDLAGDIAHSTFDGTYVVCAVVPPPPGIKVVPSYVKGACGVNFIVNIEIQDLAAALDMWGWEAKLGYNTTMLDALASAEGPFLPGFAGPNGTFYINLINDTAGVIHTGGLFLGGHTKPWGDGVVAILTFNASWQFTVPPGKPPVTCALDLYETKLVDSKGPINHTVTDGMYEAPYKTIGWALDCWTDPYRKKCDVTGFEGKGPNANASAYEPQDMVILYAKLTYNQQPECNKTVAFEIYGPRNPWYNVSIIRTARTNCSGIAKINFTIPWPDNHPQAIIFGKWICFQKAQVKNPWLPGFSESPNDTLWFEVGWIVELLTVRVSPDPVRKCQWLNITITYKNIALIPKHVVFTFVLLDDLLDPIGELVVPCIWIRAGKWCHPANDTLTVSIHIPTWAHNGPRCQVFVNAFTDLPMKCGCPYCPEISRLFTITYP